MVIYILGYEFDNISKKNANFKVITVNTGV